MENQLNPELPASCINIEEKNEEQTIHTKVKTEVLENSSPQTHDGSELVDINMANPIVEEQTPVENVQMEKLVGRHVLKHILDTAPPLDTILSCSDGKLGAHKAVLVSASPFLGLILSRRVAGELVTIVVPDISIETMTSILTLCYTGEMLLTQDKEDAVYSAMEALMIGVEADFTLKTVKKKKPSSLPTSPPDLKPDLAELGEASTHKNSDQEVLPPPPEISHHEIASTSSRKSRTTRKSTAKSVSLISSSKTSTSKTSPSPKPKRGRPKSKAVIKHSGAKENTDKTLSVDSEKKSSKSTSKSRSRRSTPSSSIEIPVNNSSIISKSAKDLNKSATTSTFIKNQNATAKKSFCGIMLEGSNHVCLKCDGILPNKPAFKKHLCNSHGSSLSHKEVSSSEMKELLECGICAKKYSSLSRTSDCIKGHGFSKCYTCFGLIHTDKLAEHYVTVHGLRTTFALVSRCRWCDLAVDIGKNATKPQNHAISDHISLSLTAPSEDDKNEMNHVDETGGGTTSKSSSSSLAKKEEKGNNKPAGKRKRSESSEGKQPHHHAAEKESNTTTTSSKSQRSSSSSLAAANLQSGSLIPFFKRSGQIYEKEMVTPRPPTKRRKLDDQGKPLQLGKRTGGVSPLSRKKLFQDKYDATTTTKTNSTTSSLSSTGGIASFSKDPPSFVTNPGTGKIIGFSLENFPTVNVRLEELWKDACKKASVATTTTAEAVKVKIELPSPSSGNEIVAVTSLPASSSISTTISCAVAKETAELICVDDDDDDDDQEEGYDFPMLSNNESLVPMFSENEVLGAIENMTPEIERR